MKQKYYFDKSKTVKKEIRIIGIDDSPFKPKQEGHIMIIGTIHRGGRELEGVLSTSIGVDGDDSTEKIAEMINNSRHKDQLQVIMTDGIAVGGFNVIDIKKLADLTELPVIVVVRNNPNIDKVKAAIKNVNNHKNKLKLIKSAGKIRSIKVSDGEIYFQCAGIQVPKARQIIKISVTKGHMPEPIRTAHLIASGIVSGESRGRA